MNGVYIYKPPTTFWGRIDETLNVLVSLAIGLGPALIGYVLWKRTPPPPDAPHRRR